MENDVIYSLRPQKDLENDEYFEVLFTGKVSQKWLGLFEKNCDEYNRLNKVLFESTGGHPLSIENKRGKYIWQWKGSGSNEIIYKIGSKNYKFVQTHLDKVVERTNLQIDYK